VGLIKADLRISIKECQHNENLETRSRPVRPVTSGACLGSGPSFSSQVGKEQAYTGFDEHNVLQNSCRSPDLRGWQRGLL
jgi:hypothetical protein